MAHNNNVDYQALIDKAVVKGDFGAAAQLEEARNEKIDDLGLNYEKTYKYTQYGDSGDTSSSGSPASVSYSAKSEQPTYTDNQQGLIDSVSTALMNRDAFSYDPESDPLYQSYQKQYTRQGQTAMQDTLGQIAARTGGMASSYAGTAAQQTYDNYMQALSDKIPELQQAAYEMYRDQGSDMRDNLSMLLSLESNDYNKYLNDLAQYNTNRQFDYNARQDAIGNEQWQKQFDTGNEQWQKQFDTENEQWDKDFNYRAQQDALNRSASLSGGSPGGSSGGSSDGSSDDWSAEDWYSAMYQSGDPYMYLMQSGYSPSEIDYILKNSGYYLWVDEQKNLPTTDNSTYMVEGMGEYGKDDISDMLDAGEIYATKWDKNGKAIAFAVTGNTRKGLSGKTIGLTQ